MAKSPPAISKLAIVHAFYQLMANNKTERLRLYGSLLPARHAAISSDIV
jgi:hypothetical protein